MLMLYVFSSNEQYRQTGSTPLTVIISAESEQDAWSELLTPDRWPFNEEQWWDMEVYSVNTPGILTEVVAE